MSAHGHVDLGHTVAGWTGTTLALLGFAGAGAALCAAWPPGILIGLAVVALAGVATWLLHLAGWGKPSGPRSEADWDWRVRDTAARAGHADCLGCRVAARPRRAPVALAPSRPAVPLAADEAA
ncbi:HGxxPAAW family protein [Streptomyces sp. NRRL F-2664]|uniref:HGxxPAAW family protein n=1 Tax=Streptomyces sp. NRRL F-2664 TaxID=1463842 RepID=UPI0004C87946|nr:HGxxPAAW family protein [Streptomyces sp. NRRL F-2664]